MPATDEMKQMAEPAAQLAVVDQRVDHVPVPDEVDLHQVWTIGDTSGREQRVNLAHLFERAVDRRRVAQVDLNAAAESGLDGGVVQIDHLGSEVTHDLGRRGAHAGGTSDYQRPLAVVAELLDTSHVNPLLECQR